LQQEFWAVFSLHQKSRTLCVKAGSGYKEIVLLVGLSKIWYSILLRIIGRPSWDRSRNYSLAVALNSEPDLPQTNVSTATFQVKANSVSAGVISDHPQKPYGDSL